MAARDNLCVELRQISDSEWRPATLDSAAMIDRLPEELGDLFGWTWQDVEEDGLGTTAYVFLADRDGPRFRLSASRMHPGDGVSLDASHDEDPARARADFLAATELPADVFLAVREGNTWFARWDPPHQAGQRPPSVASRGSAPDRG